MTIFVIPALIRMQALVTGFDLDLFGFFLAAVEVPDMVIDPAIITLCLPGDFHRDKRVVLVLAVDHNEDLADLQFTPGDDVVLKTCILDMLGRYLASILYFVEVIAGFCLSQNVSGTIVVVIAEGRFTDDFNGASSVLASIAFLSGIVVPGRYTVISS